MLLNTVIIAVIKITSMVMSLQVQSKGIDGRGKPMEVYHITAHFANFNMKIEES